jgi:sugar/nucleoside kinase (ribokinase family)
MTEDPSMLDVIGVGMVNLDYIASASSHRQRDSEAMLEIRERFEHGAESVVDEGTIVRVLEQLGGRDTLQLSLGGSAFLAIQALASTGLGLRLGFVGVAGRSPDVSLSPLRRLDQLGIDRSRLRLDLDRSSGMCISYIHEGERTLLTWAGANAGFAGYVDDELDALAEYLARARHVHVTSLLDPASATRLCTLVEEAKRRNPELKVSFDPGHAWCVDQPAAAMGLLRVADYLFLNYREFKLLGGQGELGEFQPDEGTAARVLSRCGPSCAAVVLKRYDRVLVYRRRGERVTGEEYGHQPLDVDVIEDATGAGDVFAAGMLAAMTSDQLRLELGSLLGMKMARHKLRHVGDRGYPEFTTVAQRFLRSWGAEREAQLRPPGVFIAHGGSPLWRSVVDFLREELDLDVHYFEKACPDSNEVTATLNEQLRRCSFAVCVLTGEDEMADGGRRARQNIVHEAGLFQGRYGFQRVAMLADERCELPSNLSGLVRLDFQAPHIEQTFANLMRHLRREGLLPEAGLRTRRLAVTPSME